MDVRSTNKSIIGSMVLKITPVILRNMVVLKFCILCKKASQQSLGGLAILFLSRPGVLN